MKNCGETHEVLLKNLPQLQTKKKTQIHEKKGIHFAFMFRKLHPLICLLLVVFFLTLYRGILFINFFCDEKYVILDLSSFYHL